MKVLIIGLGYVGVEVAKFYADLGAEITATTTKPERIDEFKSLSINPFLIKPSDFSSVSDHLLSQDLILIAVAPHGTSTYEETYYHTAINLQSHLLNIPSPPKIVYLSSTSVYGDHQGTWVTESSQSLHLSPHAKILLETENVYQQIPYTCTLRLGEIYGPGREMATKVKNWENRLFPGNGESFTNIVHRDDIVRAIFYAHSHSLEGIYNLVCDEHPKRVDLYQSISEKYKLKPVLWDRQTTSSHKGNKRVDNQKIKKTGFYFLYPDILL